MASECTKRKCVTLAEWKATEEVPIEVEVENENHGKEEIEEIMVDADEGDMLSIPTHHPPKDKGNRSVLLLSLGEPPTNSPTPPTPKALTTNFYQERLEPSLTTLNHALRVSKNVVLHMFKESLASHTQFSKGHDKKRASKFKEELFAWLILFQQSHEEQRGGNHLNGFKDKSFLTRGG